MEINNPATDNTVPTSAVHPANALAYCAKSLTAVLFGFRFASTYNFHDESIALQHPHNHSSNDTDKQKHGLDTKRVVDERAEESAKDEFFKKVWEDLKAFMKDYEVFESRAYRTLQPQKFD